jgi:hypothetical protein
MAKTYRDDNMLRETRPEYLRPQKKDRGQRTQNNGSHPVQRNEIKHCTELYVNEFIDHVLSLGFSEPEVQLYSRDLLAGFGSVVSNVLRNGLHDTIIPRNARDIFNYSINRSGFPHCRIAAGQFESFIKKVKEHRMTIPNIAQPGSPLPTRTPMVTRRVLAGVDDSQPVTLLDKHIVQETSNNQMRPPMQMTEVTLALAAAETMAVRAAIDNPTKTTEEETTMTTPENNTPDTSATDAQASTSQLAERLAERAEIASNLTQEDVNASMNTTVAGDTPEIDLSGEKMVIEAMRAEREKQDKIRKTQDMINQMNVNNAFDAGMSKGLRKGMFFGATAVLTGFAIGVAISRFRK